MCLPSLLYPPDRYWQRHLSRSIPLGQIQTLCIQKYDQHLSLYFCVLPERYWRCHLSRSVPDAQILTLCTQRYCSVTRSVYPDPAWWCREIEFLSSFPCDCALHALFRSGIGVSKQTVGICPEGKNLDRSDQSVSVRCDKKAGGRKSTELTAKVQKDTLSVSDIKKITANTDWENYSPMYQSMQARCMPPR